MKKIIILILMVSSTFSQSLSGSQGKMLLTGEKYLTGEDGIVRIQVNIWGHVRTPGSYIIFDGSDIISALSLAGGPLPGANLKKVYIITSNDGKNKKKYNLEDYIEKSSINEKIELKPFDTIVVNPTNSYRLFSQSNIVGILIQLLTLGYTVQNLE